MLVTPILFCKLHPDTASASFPHLGRSQAKLTLFSSRVVIHSKFFQEIPRFILSF